MESAVPMVRILVVQHPTPTDDGPESQPGGDDTRSALARLGRETQIELAHDPAECLARLQVGGVDLVVIDCENRDSVLEALRERPEPVVVICRSGDDGSALEAFRNGAADCVRVGDDFPEILPVVALEHIRRWRRERERGLAARRIRDLQHYNENIIQNMNSALLVVDGEGLISFANPTAEQILGASPLVGRSLWPWFASPTDERGLVARTLKDGVRFKGAETLITCDDERRVPIGISCAPLLDEEGARIGAVAIFQDLTEIKQLQRQVLQTEKMASIGQLAAGIAHEINNPMGFIHANLFQMAEYLEDLGRVRDEVEKLRKAVESGSSEEISAVASQLDEVAREVDVDFVYSDFAKAIRESQEGSERIRHIVQDLRDFSHQGNTEQVPADLNQCVDSTAGIVWTMMKHSVVLEKEYRDLPRVVCYPMQLKQVFMNLLVNAYQAVEQRVGDSGEVGEIQISTDCARDGVLVCVRDTGVGIAKRDLARIFDPFFTTKEVGAGTGLGLSTSFNIVQRHGGTIRVESEPGEGSCFEVWLPLRPPIAEAEPDHVD